MLPSWRSIMDELRELWHVKPLRGAEEEEQSGRQEWEEDSDRKAWEGRFQMCYCGIAKTRPFTVVGLQRFGASSDIWCIMIELMLKDTFRIMCSMPFTGSLVCTCQLSDFCWALQKPLKGQLATIKCKVKLFTGFMTTIVFGLLCCQNVKILFDYLIID